MHSVITPHVIIVGLCAAGVYRDMFDVCSSTLLITMVTQLFSVKLSQFVNVTPEFESTC